MAKRTMKDRLERGGIECKDTHLANQEFKEQCDINRTLDRAKRGASLSHLLNHGGRYGDFSDFNARTYNDLLERLADMHSIFYDLPAATREEFGNNPGAFFAFVNNPENEGRLPELLPELVKPGRQFPDVIGNAAKAFAEAAIAAVQEPPSGGDTEANADSGATDEGGDPEPLGDQ